MDIEELMFGTLCIALSVIASCGAIWVMVSTFRFIING